MKKFLTIATCCLMATALNAVDTTSNKKVHRIHHE